MRLLAPAAAPAPVVSVGAREVPAFLLWGGAGFGAGVAVAATLAVAAPGDGRSAGVVVVVAALAAGTFGAGALATKVLVGEERMAFYPFAVAVAAVAAGALAAAGRPVLAHLDLLAVALAVFLALGRRGCLAAGCCHGRPADRGVRYGPAHVSEGFPAHLVGVVLAPVQAVESAVALAVAAVGGAGVLAGWPAGAALGWVVTAYAAARFGLESLRGDARGRAGA
ncbi:MAG TPA: prolipoprotein diacylglyceryl transferase family protein, partial [Acidimicrobiales bacterium]|nr:prolipoprotein diacylglyceryl transferase family protein [Acidimicrobiales bacterium]